MQNVRSTIRKTIRERRNRLSLLEQNQAAQAALHQIKQHAFFKKINNVAIYLSVDGELDTRPIIDYFWRENINVYLPVLHPFSKRHLLFLHYLPDTPMVSNKFNIQEPKLDQTKVIPASQLDIIFTPLVAFDSKGQRLGMGGGYYDRTLSSWFKTGQGASPVGIAHNCQEIEQVPSENWDIPLSMIVTPNKIWQWNHSELGK